MGNTVLDSTRLDSTINEHGIRKTGYQSTYDSVKAQVMLTIGHYCIVSISTWNDNT